MTLWAMYLVSGAVWVVFILFSTKSVWLLHTMHQTFRAVLSGLILLLQTILLATRNDAILPYPGTTHIILSIHYFLATLCNWKLSTTTIQCSGWHWTGLRLVFWCFFGFCFGITEFVLWGSTTPQTEHEHTHMADVVLLSGTFIVALTIMLSRKRINEQWCAVFFIMASGVVSILANSLFHPTWSDHDAWYVGLFPLVPITLTWVALFFLLQYILEYVHPLASIKHGAGGGGRDVWTQIRWGTLFNRRSYHPLPEGDVQSPATSTEVVVDQEFEMERELPGNFIPSPTDWVEFKRAMTPYSTDQIMVHRAHVHKQVATIFPSSDWIYQPMPCNKVALAPLVPAHLFVLWYGSQTNPEQCQAIASFKRSFLIHESQPMESQILMCPPKQWHILVSQCWDVMHMLYDSKLIKIQDRIRIPIVSFLEWILLQLWALQSRMVREIDFAEHDRLKKLVPCIPDLFKYITGTSNSHAKPQKSFYRPVHPPPRHKQVLHKPQQQQLPPTPQVVERKQEEDEKEEMDMSRHSCWTDLRAFQMAHNDILAAIHPAHVIRTQLEEDKSHSSVAISMPQLIELVIKCPTLCDVSQVHYSFLREASVTKKSHEVCFDMIREITRYITQHEPDRVFFLQRVHCPTSRAMTTQPVYDVIRWLHANQWMATLSNTPEPQLDEEEISGAIANNLKRDLCSLHRVNNKDESIPNPMYHVDLQPQKDASPSSIRPVVLSHHEEISLESSHNWEPVSELFCFLLHTAVSTQFSVWRTEAILTMYFRKYHMTLDLLRKKMETCQSDRKMLKVAQILNHPTFTAHEEGSQHSTLRRFARLAQTITRKVVRIVLGGLPIHCPYIQTGSVDPTVLALNSLIEHGSKDLKSTPLCVAKDLALRLNSGLEFNLGMYPTGSVLGIRSETPTTAPVDEKKKTKERRGGVIVGGGSSAATERVSSFGVQNLCDMYRTEIRDTMEVSQVISVTKDLIMFYCALLRNVNVTQSINQSMSFFLTSTRIQHMRKQILQSIHLRKSISISISNPRSKSDLANWIRRSSIYFEYEKYLGIPMSVVNCWMPPVHTIRRDSISHDKSEFMIDDGSEQKEIGTPDRTGGIQDDDEEDGGEESDHEGRDNNED